MRVLGFPLGVPVPVYVWISSKCMFATSTYVYGSHVSVPHAPVCVGPQVCPCVDPPRGSRVRVCEWSFHRCLRVRGSCGCVRIPRERPGRAWACACAGTGRRTGGGGSLRLRGPAARSGHVPPSRRRTAARSRHAPDPPSALRAGRTSATTTRAPTTTRECTNR